MQETLLSSKFVYLTRLGDSALILAQRMSEWCGKGPALEEDMALANTALDLLGQARLWLSYAGEVEDSGRDEDAMAYLRGEREFYNLLLVELPNGNYADTMMREFLFDVWHSLALAELAHSKDARIAEIAAKAQKEVAYHLRRSSDLIVRMGDGTDQSHQYTQAAADALWAYTGEMFVGDAVDADMAASGEGFDPAALKPAWQQYVAQVFATATLQVPPAEMWMQKGGKQGIHSEHLGYLLAEMQVLQRTYPGAKW
jgi:ring-1,2-phenylacetyl-CoA epoxidase subunit PaaC